jgi:tetratricopeptide (TPR) repeat protein
MKQGFILFFILLEVAGFGQSADIDYWRDMGYQLKLVNDYPKAISYYQKILTADANDYDARLALAKLYTLNENYDTAIILFNEIYTSDSTDVEALNGLGECYSLLGENQKSIVYYEKALFYLPNTIQQYFYLAKAYSHGDKLDQAIGVYKQINKIDDTWSEAWAGIGKMYYWKGMPATASFYYSKAMELDPENEALRTEYATIQNELKFGLTIKVSPLQEKEENYEINALVSSIKLEKRLNDNFHVDANFLLDYSNRVFTDNIGDTTRWFNNAWVKGSWIKEHHKVSLYGGYSASDNKMSTYGLNWSLNYMISKISIKNSLTAGYDYFYYWNKVGSTSLSDEVWLGYKIFGLSGSYTFGSVDDVLIIDVLSDTTYTDNNPYYAYGISLNCKVLANPEVKIGLNHSYLDYKYKSPLYYSPFGRKLTGASVSIYYAVRKLYTYGSFAYNIGSEFNFEEKDSGKYSKVTLNVNNWTSNVELGYNYAPFSFSIGASSFYNPYYQNLTGFVAVKVLF